MGDTDIPSPIDFHDLVQAKAWEQDTIARRPWRPEFFAAFVSELNAHFRAGFSLLELGSGPGHLAGQILSHSKAIRYAALDFSDAMHELAHERLGGLSSRVEFVTRDFRRADWSNGLGPFDAIVTIQAAHELRHKRHLPNLLTQIHTLLRPNGIFLYCDHYAGNRQSPDLMLDIAEQPIALAQAGFTSIRLVLDRGGMALFAARHR